VLKEKTLNTKMTSDQGKRHEEYPVISNLCIKFPHRVSPDHRSVSTKSVFLKWTAVRTSVDVKFETLIAMI
jgi:hypothetical protein